MTPQELHTLVTTIKSSQYETFYLKTPEFTILVSGNVTPITEIKKNANDNDYDIGDKDMEDFYGIDGE